MNSPAIITKNLSKSYGRLYAVKELNLTVAEGTIFGFLGPNGAGKTTTMGLLTGILRPTSGEVYLFGKNFRQNYFELKRSIGVVPEYQCIYEDMTPQEYLSFFCNLYCVDDKSGRIDKLLKRVDLHDKKNVPMKKFSKGMKQKISICRALIHEPKILFLDEPTQGLDPAGVREIKDILLDLKKEKGVTVFISSHILSEIEKLCDEVGIINEGRLVTKGDMRTLRKIASKGNVELDLELDKITKNIIESLKKLDFVEEVNELGKNALRIKISDDKDRRGEISKTIYNEGGTIVGMKENRVTLEDAFLEITKGNIKILEE